MSIFTKLCPGCNRDLPITEFSKHTGNSTGYQSRCRPCQNEQAKVRRAEGKISPRKLCDPVEVERIWRARGGVKACTKCGHVKARDQFKPRPKQKDGAACECKDCRNAQERANRYERGTKSSSRKVSACDYPDATWRRLEVSNARQAWDWWVLNAPSKWLELRDIARDHLRRSAWQNMRHKRRARQRLALVGPITSAQLDTIRYAATNCCWCGCALTKPIRWKYAPTDATIEHITPLARGGQHSRDNIAVACASCNFSRGSRAA